MVDPDRSLLEDLVEIDEATLPFRTVKDPTAGGQGRSRQGKMRIAGAVELSPEGEPRRIRLAPIGDFSARSLHAFVAGTSAPGARVITDGWSGYPGLPDHDHQPKVVGATPAHLVLIWIHRVFSNLKRWALGTFHGLRRAHLRRYLDEFVFRWNRRRHTATAFDTLLGIGKRASDPPTTATSSDNASDPGRPGASHRPPSDPPQSGAEYRSSSLPDSTRNLLPQVQKLPHIARHGPKKNRAWNVEGGASSWCRTDSKTRNSVINLLILAYP